MFGKIKATPSRSQNLVCLLLSGMTENNLFISGVIHCVPESCCQLHSTLDVGLRDLGVVSAIVVVAVVDEEDYT